MIKYKPAQLRWSVISLTVAISLCPPAPSGWAQENTPSGQRVFSAGHSFHMFVPRILSELAASSGIEDHRQIGTQSIGGSYVYQHWNRPDEKNSAKAALKSGNIDVLTLSPIYLPDDGIENFTALALENNAEVRIVIQEFWLPFDVFNKNYKQKRPTAVDRDARTAAEIHAQHDPYFKEMDDHVRALNEKHGKSVLFVVPAGQAVVLLREKIIAGEAAGLTRQSDLFRDAIGHGKPPLLALVANCHYAVIYRRSPLGLPLPGVLKNTKVEDLDELNRLLQQVAWQAVKDHPLSGVK